VSGHERIDLGKRDEGEEAEVAGNVRVHRSEEELDCVSEIHGSFG